MLSRALISSVAAAACVAAAAPAADATMLVYADGGNVREASLDGSINRAVTTDGNPDDVPYDFPSVDDAGTITAIKGKSTSRFIWTKARSGATTLNVMPWKTSTWGNFGPTSARVKPTTGSQLAYGYYFNHGPYDGGVEQRMAIVPPQAPGSPSNPVVDQPGWVSPTWLGERLVAVKGSQAYIDSGDLQFKSFLSDNSGAAFAHAEGSRDGSRFVVRRTNNTVAIVGYQGSAPNGSIPWSCSLNANDITSVAISPDGTYVGLTDGRGVDVIGIAQDGQGCRITSEKRIAATGSKVAFSAATLTPPADPGTGGGGGNPDPGTGTGGGGGGNPDPGTGGGGNQDPGNGGGNQPGNGGGAGNPGTKPAGQTGGGSTGGGAANTGGVAGSTGSGGRTTVTTTTVAAPLRVTVAGGKAKLLRKAVKAAVSTPGAGTVAATLKVGGKSAGAAKATAKGASSVTLKLRPSRAAAARVKRGAKLTITVRFTPTAGPAVTKVATVKAR